MNTKTQRRHAATAATLEPIAATLGVWIAAWCQSVGGVATPLVATQPFPYGLATQFGVAVVEAPQIVAALGIVEVVVRFDPQAPYVLPPLPGLRPRTKTWVYTTVPGTDAQTAFTAFLTRARQLFLWHCPGCAQPQVVTPDGEIAAHADARNAYASCSGSGQPVVETQHAWRAQGRAPNATKASAASAAAVDVVPQPARCGVRTTVVDFHDDGVHPAVKATVHAFRDDAGVPTVAVNGACAVRATPWPTATYGTAARQAIADVLTMAGVKPDERFVYADVIMARLDRVTSR
jgi:hypothetical protein